MSTVQVEAGPIRGLFPVRFERLNWSTFHTKMVLGLGRAWILDGLPRW
jgi:hypothetical protein